MMNGICKAFHEEKKKSEWCKNGKRNSYEYVDVGSFLTRLVYIKSWKQTKRPLSQQIFWPDMVGKGLVNNGFALF